MKQVALAFFNKIKASENKPSSHTSEKVTSDTEKKLKREKSSQDSPTKVKPVEEIEEEKTPSIPTPQVKKQTSTLSTFSTDSQPSSIPTNVLVLEVKMEGEELDDLPSLHPDNRNKILKLYKDALLMDFKGAEKARIEKKANAIVTSIEKELKAKHAVDSSYLDEARDLKRFLSEANNTELRLRLLNCMLSPRDFIYADKKTLLPKPAQDKLISHSKELIESKQSDWIGKTNNDGMYACKKCKSKKTYMSQQQTRSADEPMTTFVVCRDCRATLKF
jgi:transcription elongation factor S-II